MRIKGIKNPSIKERLPLRAGAMPMDQLLGHHLDNVYSEALAANQSGKASQ